MGAFRERQIAKDNYQGRSSAALYEQGQGQGQGGAVAGTPRSKKERDPREVKEEALRKQRKDQRRKDKETGRRKDKDRFDTPGYDLSDDEEGDTYQPPPPDPFGALAKPIVNLFSGQKKGTGKKGK